ncbi:uncharacterized protein LOC115450668 [Manduca sexta]|uniref:Uncharacterized protein n=1 Tax=Manduca sexta TaxID=7130 RepID=A0A921ZPF6_MANSE|nr:uncharacterized protein LOC115450668 [Manduca sexta]KAG6461033.1 hypothetical protein O3G_MSEX012384 [Manduca sexta]
MSVEGDRTKCKQRFKGVENFLRRVAFNLGNTPSQTEVKIISCIPIDVTDLQQKIIQLEKQLEDAKTVKETAKENGKDASKDTSKNTYKESGKSNSKDTGKDIVKESVNIVKAKGSEVSDNTNKRASAIHTALYSSHFPRLTRGAVSKGVECSQSSQAIQCDDLLSKTKRKKSAVSFLLSTAASNKAINGGFSSDKSNLTSEERSHTVLNELRKKFLKKKKKAANKHKVETQLVYYARTDNARYNSRSTTRDFTATETTTLKNHEMINQNCLSNVARKQYKTGKIIDRLSDSSQFSSPICRDVDETIRKSRTYESDICSCCHETFHNVDNYITNSPVNEFANLTYYNHVNVNRNAYYDSSLYDLVPVKEKPVRIEIPKRKENKIDMKCWPENVRAKARCPTVVVNYNTVTPTRPDYTKKLYTKALKKNFIEETMTTQDKRVAKFDQHTAMESSKSCCVDLGELYPKPVQKAKTVIMTEAISPPHRNAECFTDVVSAVDCQTVTPKLDDKTEITLNQIKNILQSVLTEVKTNSQLKNTNKNAKKDAIIQKGTSQSNLLDGSSFLNSFTYSPYNINPYGPSCSKQMPSNYFCHPGMPQSLRCMQNYPLFIHTPGRQMCTSCYRSSQYKSCPKNTTAATNTDEQDKRGKETEKLIKEIYKSVALGVPGKDTSSEYDDLKSARTASNRSKQSEVKDTKHLISEIFKNTDMQVNTSDTHNTNTTVFYRNHKDVSTRSHSETTEPGVERRNKNKKVEDNTQPSTETELEEEKRKYPRRVVQATKRIETISESTNSESSSSESESDVTAVSIKKPVEKKKSGLFSKVCNLFNRNKKKKDTKAETEAESESSDSDYQTVYSQKINMPKRKDHRTQRSRAHSKLHSRRSRQAQRSPERPKRTPYMEQEYRRLWNEKLMFQNTRPRYSSEKPVTRETTPRSRQRPVYYRNYEARSVLVDPRSYQPRYDVINRKPCLAEVNNQIKPHNYLNLGNVGEGRIPLRHSINGTRGNAVMKDAMIVQKAINTKAMTKGLTWLKKHKPGCGEQWKKFIIEG